MTDCKYKDSIASVVIKLVGSDESSIETVTFSDGSYFFDSTRININTQYVVTTQVGLETRTVSNKYGYLNSSDKVRINTNTNSKIRNLKVDFCLVPREPCTILNLPILLFKKNSATDYYFDKDDNSPYDTLSFLSMFMIDNSMMIFEIRTSYGLNEKNGQQLALKRADYIKTLLMKSGVEAERLEIKATKLEEEKGKIVFAYTRRYISPKENQQKKAPDRKKQEDAEGE